MLNIKQLIAMWAGILVTGYFWVIAANFPTGSHDEDVFSRYTVAIGLIAAGVVLSLADRRKNS